MNELLKDSSYSLEERYAMALEVIMLKDKQIEKLNNDYESLKTSIGWEQDQNSIHRMGL
jgi:cytochrome c553